MNIKLKLNDVEIRMLKKIEIKNCNTFYSIYRVDVCKIVYDRLWINIQNNTNEIWINNRNGFINPRRLY